LRERHPPRPVIQALTPFAAAENIAGPRPSMSALTSLLARDQVVPVRKIEEALQKQVVSGGEIATVLLELEAIAENTLAAYQGALAELLPATRDEVMRVSRDTVRLIPREVAEKHRIVPLAVDGRALIVATAAPLEAEVEGQIGFLLGYELVSRIVCDVRIAAALQHHYGIEPTPRFRRLIDKLRHREAGEVPWVAPPQMAKVERTKLSQLPKKASSASWLDDEEDEPVVLPPRRSSMPPPSDGRTTDPNGFARPTAVPAQTAAPVPPAAPFPPAARATPPRAAPASVAPPPLDGGPTEIVASPFLSERTTDHGVPPPPSAPAQSSSGAVPARVLGVGVRRSSRPPAPSELPTASPFAIPRAAALPGASSLASRASSVPGGKGFVSSRDSGPPDLTPTQRAIRKMRGPLTAAAAVKLLDEASGRDDVLEVFFAFARQFFDYAALFAVSGDLAEGRDAFGSGASVEAVRRVAVPLEVPGSFNVARKTRAARVARMDGTELDRLVVKDLGRPRDAVALVLPIVLRERAVLFLYGDRGTDAFDVSDVPELIAFVPRVVGAIERAILRRKKSGGFARVDEKPAASGRDELKAAAKSVGSLPPSRAARPAKPSDRWSSPPPAERTSAPPVIAQEAVAPRSLADVIASTALSDASVEMHPGDGGLPAASVLSAKASTAPRTGEEVARAVRSPTRASTLRQMVGIPRSAPPPPKSDAFDLGMIPIPGIAALPSVPEPLVTGGSPSGREGRDTFPEGLLPASGRTTEPAPPPKSARADDDEPELVVDQADDSDFDADDLDASDADDVTDDEGRLASVPQATSSKASGSSPPAARETYLYKDASVDVVGRARPARRSDRPPATTPKPEALSPRDAIPLTRRVDPRREDDSTSSLAERVRIPKQERVERAAPTNVRPRDVRGSVPPPGAPSVIVDMGEGVNELVQDLVHAGPDDEGAIVDALMKLGDAPLPVLAQAFPGPLWFDRRKPHRKAPRGRDLSAITRALFAYRDRAIPYVASLLGSADTERRYVAAMLTSELLHGGLVDALVQRVFDDDDAIRKLSVESLGRHRGLPEMQEVLVFLRRTARIRGKDPQKRLRAISALGGIRDSGALRLLVELLEDEDGGVVHAAHLALVEITCEDLGASARKWSAWADRNEQRHRIEWLIDALTHGDEALRSAAGEDLKSLTQQYFGFHPPSSKKDREVVQQKYRTWWETQGRRIHTAR
jgi:hypothetical protein